MPLCSLVKYGVKDTTTSLSLDKCGIGRINPARDKESLTLLMRWAVCHVASSQLLSMFLLHIRPDGELLPPRVEVVVVFLLSI